MIISAFAALASMGGAPRASIAMGRGDKEEAERIMGNCTSILLVLSVVLTAIFLLCNRQFLLLFGAAACVNIFVFLSMDGLMHYLFFLFVLFLTMVVMMASYEMCIRDRVDAGDGQHNGEEHNGRGGGVGGVAAGIADVYKRQVRPSPDAQAAAVPAGAVSGE